MTDALSDDMPKPLPGAVFRHFLHEDAQFGKLVTSHDRFHIHKTLGVLSVLSFVYRYAWLYPTTGSLGFAEGTEGPAMSPLWRRFNWLTMAVHTLLAVSSIIFVVPRKRIAAKPMVIYEEYRQHAIVFSLRCFLVFASATLFPESKWLPVVSVLLIHLAADRITAFWGMAGNTAVRATASAAAAGKVTNFYKIVGYGYSLYQFGAIASHILPNAHLADLGFNALIAIQSSAFMMTLYRKRIIRGRTHMAVYATCLVISAFHIIRLVGVSLTFVACLAYVLRVNLPRKYSNKYLLWAAFLLVAHWVRAGTPTDGDIPLREIVQGPPTFKGVSVAALFFFIFHGTPRAAEKQKAALGLPLYPRI